MFTHITWGNYLFTVALLLVVYYLIIAATFYRADAKRLLSAKLKKDGSTPDDGYRDHKEETERSNEVDQYERFDGPQDSFAYTTDETFAEVEALILQLKTGITDAAAQQLSKEDTALTIRGILKNHSSLKDTAFQSSLTELIVSECEKTGSITLSEEEVEELWE
ncbi:hypothetical protein [Mucilaginibacter paludis]|uniref:Uncharacterized protein n=1 Tax=Mucilaginibacter paludis DSM 18603 TaxID=714943 RepID=H1YBU4_9SPHI|nr:hypothetical protein [Mucilaginibacter paludis]EHQ27022.1 hypothetical protein Mucpa_2914 [Mucilaginibacter paludis DSM 18603]